MRIRRIKKKPGRMSFLDLGAGSGERVTELAERKKKRIIAAIDLRPSRKLEHEPKGLVVLRKSILNGLKMLPSNSVKVINSDFVLYSDITQAGLAEFSRHPAAYRKKILGEVKRVLAKNGRFYITEAMFSKPTILEELRQFGFEVAGITTQVKPKTETIRTFQELGRSLRKKGSSQDIQRL